MHRSAAAERDALKHRGDNGRHHPGHTFIPASVETHGYLGGKPLVRCLKARWLPREDRQGLRVLFWLVHVANSVWRRSSVRGMYIVVALTSWQGLLAGRCREEGVGTGLGVQEALYQQEGVSPA